MGTDLTKDWRTLRNQKSWFTLFEIEKDQSQEGDSGAVMWGSAGTVCSSDQSAWADQEFAGQVPLAGTAPSAMQGDPSGLWE